MDLLWGYLAFGFLAALIYSMYFTKMVILKKAPSEKSSCEIYLKADQSLYILNSERFSVVFTNVEDEILFSGFNSIFKLKLGLLFLVSGLIWPVFLVVLILILCALLGKQLTTKGE